MKTITSSEYEKPYDGSSDFDKDSVAMFVNFEYKDIPKDSFTHFLGRFIYSESFE